MNQLFIEALDLSPYLSLVLQLPFASNLTCKNVPPGVGRDLSELFKSSRKVFLISERGAIYGDTYGVVQNWQNCGFIPCNHAIFYVSLLNLYSINIHLYFDASEFLRVEK